MSDLNELAARLASRKPRLAECDCCGEFRRTVRFVGLPNSAGCETYACNTCRGIPEDDEDDEDEPVPCRLCDYGHGPTGYIPECIAEDRACTCPNGRCADCNARCPMCDGSKFVP